MDTDSTASAQVNIFHRVYQLRSREGEEHLRSIARMVDERMRTISSQLATHDVAKVAVLAALNFADELQIIKQRYEHDLQTLLSQVSAAEESAAAAEAEALPETNRREAVEQRSWFEDIFGADEPLKRDAERLSSRVTAKLQTLRQTERESPTIQSDEEHP